MRRIMVGALLAVSVGAGCDSVQVNRTPNGSTAVTVGERPQPQCTNRECGDDRAGGVCGTCTAGFACDAQGHCQMQAAVWSIVVERAQITPRDRSDGNSSWDPEGGAPDPRVCFTASAPGVCSPAVQETLTPIWNLAAGSFAPTDLMRGVTLQIEDVDDLVNDTVTNCRWTPTRELFRSGMTIVHCPGANITVRAVPL